MILCSYPALQSYALLYYSSAELFHSHSILLILNNTQYKMKQAPDDSNKTQVDAK